LEIDKDASGSYRVLIFCVIIDSTYLRPSCLTLEDVMKDSAKLPDETVEDEIAFLLLDLAEGWVLKREGFRLTPDRTLFVCARRSAADVSRAFKCPSGIYENCRDVPPESKEKLDGTVVAIAKLLKVSPYATSGKVDERLAMVVGNRANELASAWKFWEFVPVRYVQFVERWRER